MKRPVIERLYSIFVVLAFGLLFFANAEAQEAPNGVAYNLGIGKAFYVPCGLALLSSFFLPKKRDRLDIALAILVFVAIFSSLIHPPLSEKFLSWEVTRFVFAILCFKDIRNIDPLMFARHIAIASPFIIFPHYLLSDPFSYGPYRYGGFYGDPNFLALALNIIISLCYITFRHHKGILIRILCIGSIVGAIPLVLFGMSRGGILGLAVVLAAILVNTFKKSKLGFVLMTVVLIVVGGFFAKRTSDTIDLIESRYQAESEADRVGVRARIEGVQDAFRVLSNRPELIPFGIGLGNTYDTRAIYRDDGFRSSYVIHNTYVSLLYELGLIGLILYLMIYFHAFRQLFRQRNLLLLGILLSAIVSLFTLPGAAFMPGWILLFFMANKSISKV